MLPITGADEELNLGEERLKVWDVWHGELHESGDKRRRSALVSQRNHEKLTTLQALTGNN